MYYLKSAIAIVSAAFFLSSCSQDPDIVLPRQGGTWIIESLVVVTYEDGAKVSELINENLGEFRFEKDGKGVKELYDEESVKLMWNYSNTKNELTITEKWDSPTVFKVEDSQRKFQTWENITGDITKKGIRMTYFLKRK